jgi:hypothetical protein
MTSVFSVSREPIWYYNPRQPFPNPKMLKGRFLGVAQNVGDAFCFLILTQPEGDNAPTPQVLARSVIRRRYPRGSTDTESHENVSTPLAITFYCNDERTPLPDPPLPDVDDIATDPMMDVVADNPVELRTLLSSRSETSKILQPSDEFEDGILEVFGPPPKRPRLSMPDSEGVSLGTQPAIVPPLQDAIPEERSVFTDMVTTGQIPMTVHDSRPVPHFDTVPDVQSHLTASTPAYVAADAPADRNNDGSSNDPGKDPQHEDEFRQITQDDDLEPQVFSDITHQFERVAEGTSTDELFDRIDGHSWRDGALMFQIRWKTDELSTLPFKTVKNDYPRKVADYVLKHKLGNSSGRYTGGRYTRWARQFNRNYDRIGCSAFVSIGRRLGI